MGQGLSSVRQVQADAEVWQVSKLHAAQKLASEGFKVFPITPGAKAPPLIKDWPKLATTDARTIDQWWQANPDANIGIHCDGLVVIDVDPKNGGDDSFNLLEITHGIPDTRVTRTPSGGRHFFYRHEASVSNGVNVLGRGLDIRSHGGYVVAAGSETPAGSYSAANGSPIAGAPDWLVQKCGVFTERERAPKVNVPDADDVTFTRAAAWLALQEPAIQGQGGDAHTFKIACGLRDLGVSQLQAFGLLAGEWNSRCSPPLSAEELGVKAHNAYNYGQNPPGARAASPKDFPVVHESAPSTNSGQRGILSLAEFAEQPGREAGYAVKGLLQRASYAEVYGAPGEGKTFVALDLAYHIAGNLPWMGHKVHAGPVLYLAFEGTGGLIRRAQALRQHYGKADVPLYLAGAAMDVRTSSGRGDLDRLLAELPSRPVLIVIDTLARALMGGDENSAQDVGAFNNVIQGLIEATGACVLIIHHSGKDKSRGARGSSALLAALDTEIEIDAGMILARKQRDVEIAPPIGFRLASIPVGIDSDGDATTSCVVMPAEAQQVRRPRLKANNKAAFDVLCQLSPDNAPVVLEDWRKACEKEGFIGAGRAASKGFYNVKTALREMGYITINDDFVARSLT